MARTDRYVWILLITVQSWTQLNAQENAGKPFGVTDWNVNLECGSIYSATVSPSGKIVAVSTAHGKVFLLDALTGRKLSTIQQNLPQCFLVANSVVFSKDGEVVAASSGCLSISFWDTKTGKETTKIVVYQVGDMNKQPPMLDPPITEAFSPDGRRLAIESVVDGRNSLSIYDVKSGLLSSRFHLGSDGEITVPFTNGRTVFTPDGSMLATAYCSRTISLFNLQTGKEIREFNGSQNSISALAFSSKGQMLVSAGGDTHLVLSSRLSDSEDNTLKLWKVASGKCILGISGHTDAVRSVVFSPDDHTLLSGGLDQTIRLWETLTGKQVFRRSIGEKVNQVAFFPDGKKVVAALDNGSVSMFSLDTFQSDSTPRRIHDKTFTRLWADLSGEDPAQAYHAVQTLSAAGDDIPARIARRLRPAGSIAPILANLGNDDFDCREAASKQLAALGPQAEPALRKALAETQSDEVRSRIRPLLKAIDQWVVTDPDTLRALRAIWVLERIGTPAARAVLADLAHGAPEVCQTQEAQAALDFLDKRAAVKP